MNRSFENVQRQGPSHIVNPVFEEPDDIGPGPDEGWAKRNLLSLDGGGIRGYWSLLALGRLMERIGIVEEKIDAAILHSFLPEPWPESLKIEPADEEELKHFTAATSQRSQLAAVSKGQRYFPCHYFDYIGGSSTGALIAIMLGRFRMSVPECIKEYKNLGEKVFGNPHFFTTLNFGVFKRYQFDAGTLEEVFKDVTKRRSERMSASHERMKFPFKRGVCRTFVTTLMTESDQKVLGQTYLIRSYNHTRRMRALRTATGHTSRTNTGSIVGPSRMNSDNINTVPNRVRTGMTDLSVGEPMPTRRNSGTNDWNAQEFEIWEVARAATAAPFYFEPLKIQFPSSEKYMLFKDGGFNYANNPTKEGTKQIEESAGDKAIGIIVSVGTARADEPPRPRRFLPFLPVVQEMALMANDPERIHQEMQTMSQKEDLPFPYYRLNYPGKLHIGMDEWEPKKRSAKQESGSVTLETIKHVFDEWAGKPETIDLLEECAQLLVRRRRARVANRSKWERYATGAKFTCRLYDCDREDEWFDRDQFLDHLRRDHRVYTEVHLDAEAEARKKDWRYQ